MTRRGRNGLWDLLCALLALLLIAVAVVGRLPLNALPWALGATAVTFAAYRLTQRRPDTESQPDKSQDPAG